MVSVAAPRVYEEFDRVAAGVVKSLGDATRRAILIAIKESTEPLAVSDVAEMFGIHRTVARHHLNLLAGEDFVTTSTATKPRTVGRPAKRYQAGTREVHLDYPPRNLGLLVELLTHLVETVGPTDRAEVAYRFGHDYGEELAAELGDSIAGGLDGAITTVADAMRGIGFGARAETHAGQLLTSHCPFGAYALDHPEVVCSFDRGIVAGLMGSIHRQSQVEIDPHKNLEEVCVTSISPQLQTANP
ncbi:MAG: helix-turn-helix domain-containing protein [Acidimicrobiia bacterium]